MIIRSITRKGVISGALALMSLTDAAAQVFPETLDNCVIPCNSPSGCGRFDGPYSLHALIEQTFPGCQNLTDIELNHAALIATPAAVQGNVLLWFNHNLSVLDDPPPAVLTSDTFLFNPDTFTIRPCPGLEIPIDHEIGCAGFPALPWGALFNAGGHRPHVNPGVVGTDQCLQFDPVAERWSPRLSGHDIPNMATPRHYGMTLMLPPFGSLRTRIWTIGGGVANYEIYDIQGATWTTPAGVPANLTMFNYVLAHLVPNNFPTNGYSASPGLVFCPNAASTAAGAVPTFFFDPDPAAAPVWIDKSFLPQVPDRSSVQHVWGSSVILCRPDPGDTTAYKCLVVLLGGCCRPPSAPNNYTNQATNAIEFIEDPSNPISMWVTSAVSLNCDRVFIESVIFPTGDVGIFGGVNAAYGDLWDDSVPTPLRRTTNVEIYTPPPVGAASGDSIALAAADPVVRAYHSAAVLLDDGRVFQAGGEATNIALTCPLAPGWCDLSLYEPPYWHQGPRPTALTASGSMTHGSNIDITVTLPPGTALGKVTLTRPCTSTHHVDFDQRYIELRVPDPPAGAGNVTFSATLPVSEYVAPPGYYMLWVVTAGPSPVPSERAAFIQIH